MMEVTVKTLLRVPTVSLAAAVVLALPEQTASTLPLTA
jgi:hypothetical protein